MNWVTFCVLFLLWGVASWIFLGKREKSREALAEHGLIGLLGALSSMLLMTAYSFVPDDWSACRLSWSGGLLKGYHLYSGDNGPSNGFFYPPVGAWFYIPAAAAGIFFQSAQASLLIGWSMSLICILSPIIILLWRLKKIYSSTWNSIIICFFLGIAFSLSLPQLRYLATMVHVDSPSALFLGLCIVLLLPLSDKDKFVAVRILVGGVFFALAALTKQSVWPIVPVLGFGIIIFYGSNNAIKFLSSSLITLLVILILFYIAGENFNEAYSMLWRWPMNQASITPISECLKQTIILNIPIILSMIALGLVSIKTGIKLNKNYKTIHSFIFLVLAGLWMIPFSILTRTKIGADANHLALPSYLFVFSILILINYLCNYISKNSIYKYACIFCVFAFVGLAAIPYIKTYCGWYLWVNNSHAQALNYERAHSLEGDKASKVYFPWQVFSTLIATGKLYHIDDCLRYEEAAGWKRSKESLMKYLPQEPFQIAIRPFGAPSYLVEKSEFSTTASNPNLLNWKIYEARF